MGNSKLEIIKKRIEKLTQEDFDLEAWKETTYSVLLRVLPENDPRLDQINLLKVDYGSWALRDATSKYNPTKTAKKKGKEVLESILDELDSVNINSLIRETFSSSSQEKIQAAESLEELQKVLAKETKADLSTVISQLIIQQR